MCKTGGFRLAPRSDGRDHTILQVEQVDGVGRAPPVEGLGGEGRGVVLGQVAGAGAADVVIEVLDDRRARAG